MHLHICFFLCIFAAEKARYSLGISECGEIWLLATTLKNAKMLTSGHLVVRPPYSNILF